MKITSEYIRLLCDYKCEHGGGFFVDLFPN
jgi:hypothetical protein